VSSTLICLAKNEKSIVKIGTKKSEFPRGRDIHIYCQAEYADKYKDMVVKKERTALGQAVFERLESGILQEFSIYDFDDLCTGDMKYHRSKIMKILFNMANSEKYISVLRRARRNNIHFNVYELSNGKNQEFAGTPVTRLWKSTMPDWFGFTMPKGEEFASK